MNGFLTRTLVPVADGCGIWSNQRPLAGSWNSLKHTLTGQWLRMISKR